MTSLSDVLLPAGFLIHCLNVALASVVACAIAVVLSRRAAWSLPAAPCLAGRRARCQPDGSLGHSAVTSSVSLDNSGFGHYRSVADIGRHSADWQRSARRMRRPRRFCEAFPVAETTAVPPLISEPVVIVPDSVTDRLQFAPPHEQRACDDRVGMDHRHAVVRSLVCRHRDRPRAGDPVCLPIQTLDANRFRRRESPFRRCGALGGRRRGPKERIAVYCSNLLPAPVTLGLIRPRIVVPAGIESILPSDQLRAVIQHEVAHIARRDLWIGLLQQVAQISNWWNPLVRLANRQLADLREQICDDIAIRDLPEPDTYAATLINIAERCSLCMPVPTTLGIGPSPARQLENRIRRIVSSPRARCVRLSRTAAVGVSAVTVLMAATILLAQVQIDSPAVQGSTENVATNPVEQPSDRPETVEAPPTAQPEKPLTLDELRPLVVDQIRSIRSLYVGYSSIGPAESGGNLREHVWAEQGFKMLKYDLPGNSTVPYASTFDGKQTYIGDFQGDKPVKAYAKDELIPGFHQSLQSTLLGWLHFGGTRESIADVILAPTATLVEAAATDEAPGPTIEIKNYVQPASKALMDVTIVLDRAHGYLPRSIAYYSVANPSWKFAYEVDEFQKVRDGATGDDRWFPTKGRYMQRTPERGEQVFTTTISKLQINDALPDDLFVLAPTTPTAAPGQEQQALAEFEKVYHLDPDQLVRRVKPPYLPGRMVNLKKWWASAFAQSDYENSGTFLPMVYPERDGKLGQPGFHFTSGVGQTGIPASDLLNGVGAALKLVMREVDDPDKLLAPLVEGDFVIRADAPAEKVIAALGQLLKSDCGIPVELELRHIEHPVVAVGGRINPPFVIEPETVVELYVTEPQPDEGEIEQGRFYDFLQAVARFIDPDRRIVSQVENAPYRNERISWHRTPLAGKDKAVLDDVQARAVLDHLEKQTGLTFTLESRKFPTTFVRRSD